MGRGLVLVAAVVVASSCGAVAERAAEEVAERAIEAEGGGDVDVNFDDGGMDIEGDGYSFDSEAGQLPDGWPGEVPVPGEFVVEGGFASEIEGEVTFQASGTFDGDCDPDFLAFLNGLPASWMQMEGIPTPDCEGTFAQAWYLDGTWQVAYALISDGDDRQFSIIVGPDSSE